MLKKKKNILLLLFLILLEIILLLNPNILINSVKEGIDLFINRIFISLFPFFILNEILLHYNLSYYLYTIKNNFLAKIFNISKSSTSIILLSLLTGHPSNAKYIKDALENNLITEEEATKLLIITFFPSPGFVITIIGFFVFDSIITGLILLLIIYSINFLLGIYIRNKIKINISTTSHIIKNQNQKFSSILKKSILNSFDPLLIILGNIVVFILFINLLNNYIEIHPLIDSFLSGVVELTTSIKKISMLDTNFNIKFSLTLFSLLFCGFSIHSQVSSILSDYNINYKKVLLYRLIVATISSSICFITLIIFTHLFH